MEKQQEAFDTEQQARRDMSERRDQPVCHDDAIRIYLAGIAYAESRAERSVERGGESGAPVPAEPEQTRPVPGPDRSPAKRSRWHLRRRRSQRQ